MKLCCSRFRDFNKIELHTGASSCMQFIINDKDVTEIKYKPDVDGSRISKVQDKNVWDITNIDEVLKQ